MKLMRLLFASLIVTWVSACTVTTDAVPAAATRQVERSTATPTMPSATIAEPTIEPTTMPKPTQTAEPTAVPKDIDLNTNVDDAEPNVFELLTSVESIDLKIEVADGLVVYQPGPVSYRSAQTWVTKPDLGEAPVPIPVCGELAEEPRCPPEVHWSPVGTHFFYETAYDQPYQLIISDLAGQQQAYTLSRHPYRTPVWSPDGQKLMLLVGIDVAWGDFVSAGVSDLEYGFWDEVWQIEMDSSGRWQPPQRLTHLQTPGIGCGSGPRSLSDSLYDRHDGTGNGFYAAKGMIWTSDDVLIYHHGCEGIMSQGYGRFDTQTLQQLAPFPGRLHSMAYHAGGNRWYAVTGESRPFDDVKMIPKRLVTGVPTDAAYEYLDTAVPVDMVFVGAYSGRIYYTSRRELDFKNIESQIGSGSSVAPFFNFYHTQLWSMEADGSNENLMWEGDYHSFSRITEMPDGSLLFVLIENDEPLYEAIVAGEPEEKWVDYYPHAHIMRLAPENKEPEIWLEDASGLFTWFPQE